MVCSSLIEQFYIEQDYPVAYQMYCRHQ